MGSTRPTPITDAAASTNPPSVRIHRICSTYISDKFSYKAKVVREALSESVSIKNPSFSILRNESISPGKREERKVPCKGFSEWFL